MTKARILKMKTFWSMAFFSLMKDNLERIQMVQTVMRNIRERGLWPQKGLNAQCEGFKCVAGKTDCCCRRLLFTQPDFENQKSHLEEYITSRGHICDFYPKYHCELNFIKQYWGAAKLIYRSSPKTRDMKEMEENVKNSLDDVPIVQIQR